MQDLCSFILRHYEVIISVVMIILSFVLFLFRKKPVNSIYSRIWSSVVFCVSATEEQCHGSSSEKLKYCLDLVYDLLLKEYPNLDISRYEVFIRSAIELVLTTPRKK